MSKGRGFRGEMLHRIETGWFSELNR